MNKFLNTQTRSRNYGFIIVELLVGLLTLAGLIFIGYTVYRAYTQENSTTQVEQKDEDTSTPETTESSKDASVTTYPTPDPIQTDSKNSGTNATVEEVNSINADLNSLDEVDSDLDVPSADFTVDEN